MKSASIETISVLGEQTRRSRKYTTAALVLSLLLGISILAALVALAKDASAHPTAGIQTQHVSRGDGAPGSLDCGPDWVVVNSPNASTSDNSLTSIAASSSSDVWAVGNYSNGTVEQTLIEHWDGSSWHIVFSPNRGTMDNFLDSVAVVPNGNAWAVGSYFNSSGYEQTLIEHWNGTAWSLSISDNVNTNSNYLDGVSVVASGDAWAVGGYIASGVRRTLIEHWNGTAWSVVGSPNANTSDNYLDGVSVVSGTDIWAVGAYENGPVYRTLTEHWDGTAWQIVASANANANTNFLGGVAAISAGDVWAVGNYHNGTALDTLTEHWDGSSWHVVYSPNPGGTTNGLIAVAAVSSTNLTAVGLYAGSGAEQTLVENGDGTSWSHIPSPDDGTNGNDLFGVTAISAGNMWAVGYYKNSNYIPRTLVIRYNTCPPTPLPTQTPGGPTATPIPSDTAAATPISSNTPMPTPTACTLQFTDVPPNSTFYPYIQCLACRGVINGYPCGNRPSEPCDPAHDPYFRPNANVTRGQIAKIIALSAGITIPVSGQTFEDVPPGSTFYTYIGQLYELGAMNGYTCGGPGEPCNPPNNRPYFRPNANATRGQLAKIDALVAGFADPPSGQTFEDVAPGNAFYTYTQNLTNRGVMSGYPCGNPEPCVPPGNLPYFRPNADVTRGQTSKIVGNTFFPECQQLRPGQPITPSRHK